MELTKTRTDDTDHHAMSINEFCLRQKICPATYYKLKKRGLGPAELRLGNIVRITPEAEAAWRVARENPEGQEADDISARDEALKTRAQRASRVAVESPITLPIAVVQRTPLKTLAKAIRRTPPITAHNIDLALLNKAA